MSLCALCGFQVPPDTFNVHRQGPDALCPYHTSRVYEDDWAANNKAVCDFLHRGVPLPRVVEPEEEDVPF